MGRKWLTLEDMRRELPAFYADMVAYGRTFDAGTSPTGRLFWQRTLNTSGKQLRYPSFCTLGNVYMLMPTGSVANERTHLRCSMCKASCASAWPRHTWMQSRAFTAPM